MFVDNIDGTLMRVAKSDQTRFEYVVWFPYTRGAMKVVREGTLLAVRNFSSDGSADHYSIIRITSAIPQHYALGTAALDGYPGFVVEAASNAAQDWAQETPTEDTTKIVCGAVPGMFEIIVPGPPAAGGGGATVARESNLPMTGERARVLDVEWTERIVNHDLQDLRDQVITLGTLANSDVRVAALWESMIRTHFGVFAYTNAGKSNLLSTLASKMLGTDSDVKLVIYDLVGEYGALLVDMLHGREDACVVYLSLQAMPKSVLQYWKSESEADLEAASREIVDTTILPKALKGRQREFVGPVMDIIRDGKMKLMEPHEGLDELVSAVVARESEGKWGAEFDRLIDHINQINTVSGLTADNIKHHMQDLRSHEFRGNSTNFARNLHKVLLAELAGALQFVEDTTGISDRFKTSMTQIVSSLNAAGRQSLYVIQDGSDAHIRGMSHDLGKMLLDARRSAGRISPPVSFIYDEADQFISSGDASQNAAMARSKETAEQLARRGRKYGLGIGIATQRIVYLDTNVLGQPHTYMVSKLPRASDRAKIQEAFGLSDETLAETLRFDVGQWLLISHSATGIDGLPIPVQVPDANERIARFLDGFEA